MVTYHSILNYGRGKNNISIYVYGGVGAGLLFYASSVAGRVPTSIGFVLGACLWTLVEYLLHRFSFHSAWTYSPGRPVHLDHHAHAASPDHIGAPVILSLPVYALLILFFWGITGNLAKGFSLSAGLACAYVAYEKFHFWTHHGKPKTQVGRFLKQYHMQHHYKDHSRSFGVTSPLWDWVFGTLPEKRGQSK